MQNTVTIKDIQTIRLPAPNSHKGQNGRLMIIGGSKLFHSASIWALETASRIVDLVHYSSTEENNELIKHIKTEFRSGIVVPRADIEFYIKEDDCILIGPGMTRFEGTRISNFDPPAGEAGFRISNLKEMKNIKDEGVQTGLLTNYLLRKYPKKQWVIDAGALQMMDVNLIPKEAILTPHFREFVTTFGNDINKNLLNESQNILDPQLTHEIAPFFTSINTHSFEMRSANILSLTAREYICEYIAKKYSCIILLKGIEDIACNGLTGETRVIEGGNAGMTKGGTGDVLAGLISALACTNDPFLATYAGSFINKKAGEELWKTVGPYFNATDVSKMIPFVMKSLIVGS